jgi:hypothetical protein
MNSTTPQRSLISELLAKVNTKVNTKVKKHKKPTSSSAAARFIPYVGDFPETTKRSNETERFLESIGEAVPQQKGGKRKQSSHSGKTRKSKKSRKTRKH